MSMHEVSNRVHIGKFLSDIFAYKVGWENGRLSPRCLFLIFLISSNFKGQEGLELNGLPKSGTCLCW